MTKHLNSKEINPVKPRFFKDKCWASPISAIGGGLSILAANEIRKKNYGKAFVYSTGSAAADYFDGVEARRYANLHPESAKLRRNRGAIEDQAWDKFRNILLGLASLTVEKIPTRSKIVLGAVVLKESVTLIAGAKAIKDHRRENDGGWPAPLPSTPIGKETMWEIGGGLSLELYGANIQESNPTLSRTVDNVASSLLAAGIVRGLQTAPEYLRAKREMDEMTTEEQQDYKPNFYKPHIGTIVMSYLRGESQQQNVVPIQDNFDHMTNPGFCRKFGTKPA